MIYQAVIFDLDGVICHTDRYHYEAWKELADELGVCFHEEVNSKLRGVSRSQCLDIILEPHEGSLPQTKEHYLEKKNTRYCSLLEHMTPEDLDPQVKETLDVIWAAGLRTAIASSSRNARKILVRLGLEHAFDAVVDGTDITHSKPDPEVFLKAAERLHVPYGKCLVVEDALAGVEAALAAGMDCAGIGDAAQAEGVTYALTRFSDLLPILAESLEERKRMEG